MSIVDPLAEIDLGAEDMPEEGGITVEIIPEDSDADDIEFIFGDEMDENIPFEANLADYVDEGELTALASDLIADYEADKRSREEWEQTYEKGLDLLGLKFEERTEPWDGACGVFHPLLTDAVVRFQSNTIQEIFPASGPVKVTVAGDVSSEKDKQALRVKHYMNHRATKTMVEYRTETEKLLFSLPIAGSSFRKIYYDPNLGRECAMFVPAEDFIVSYGTSDLSTCPRATHILKRTRNEVKKLQVNGFYRNITLQEPEPDISGINEKQDLMTGQSVTIDNDRRHTLLEMIVEVDLPGFEHKGEDGEPTGIELPYVITIEKASGEILGIRRNWREEDPFYNKRQHFVHYYYLPGFGFYGFGLVHIIGGLSKSATALLRQLIDAGTLANLPGGLKTRGLRIKGDDTPIMPGEFRDVDIPGGAIRDNIQFLPYKEPSTVLYQLLGDLVNEGRRFASAADLKASEMNHEAPVGTTLAILEKEMKVLSAVHARIHAAMGRELQILAEVIKDYGPDQYPYEVDGNYNVRDDFNDRISIVPVSDPNAGTMSMRIMTYQAALQLSATAPDIYNRQILHRRMLDVLGIDGADEIVPTDDDMTPQDPITETMNLLNGKPVKAFIGQDHEAHIEAHMAAAQNPQIMKLMEQNPNAKAVMAAGAAHIAEHLGFAYRSRIEQELGVPMPSPEEPLPPDVEAKLSRLVAQAASQLTGKAQKMAQAEESAKKQEDPIIQMQQKELAIKEQQAKDKAMEAMARIQSDLKKEQDRIQLERDKLHQQAQIEGGKIAAKLASDKLRAATEAERMSQQQGQEAIRQGIDLGKWVQDNAIRLMEKEKGGNGQDN